MQDTSRVPNQDEKEAVKQLTRYNMILQYPECSIKAMLDMQPWERCDTSTQIFKLF